MEKFFSNTNLITIFLKWKWHLLIIAVIAGLAAVIISSSLVITPKYKSFAILYPVNLSAYSDESETEQMLQWFGSKEIMDDIIETFDLSTHYKISPDYKYYHTVMKALYEKNVRIKKTPYEAIQIEVYDSDPIIACRMVDSIISFTNSLILKNHSEKYREGLIVMENLLSLKQHELDSVAAVLNILSTEYDIIDYPNKSREIARGYLRTVDGNNASNINTQEVLKWKKYIEEKGNVWTRYNNRYFDLIAEYGNYKIQYENALINTEKHITYTTVVTKPVPADKKSYPIRWLIVVNIILATLIFSIVIIAFIEINRKSQKILLASESGS